MTSNVLKKSWAWMLMLLFAVTTAVSCSDDDKSEPEPENPDRAYIGAWKLEYEGDDEIQIIVFNENFTVELYDTTKELFEEGKYEDVNYGIYTVNETAGTLRVTIGREQADVVLVGSGANLYITMDGDPAYRIARNKVPTEEAPEVTSDELSGTTWKVTSMTGWGAVDISTYRGMELRFGYNGVVEEWYSSSRHFSGSYTISGNMINFNTIPLVNDYGHEYAYSISGKTLTLTEQILGTSFILTKQ